MLLTFNLSPFDQTVAALARRRSKRAIRLPRAILRSAPVNAGWQFEQTSSTSSLVDERVTNAFPQLVQRTVMMVSSG